MVVVAKGQGQAHGNTAPERSLAAATAFRKARCRSSHTTQTANRPCAMEKWGQVVAKAIRHHCCSTLCPADKLDSVTPAQNAPFLPLPSVCQEEGRQRAWQGLSGVTHQ